MAAARSLVANGSIGKIVSISAHYFESMGNTAFGGAQEVGKKSDLGWRRSLARCGGGIVIDGGGSACLVLRSKFTHWP